MRFHATSHDPTKADVDIIITFLAPDSLFDTKKFGVSVTELVSEAKGREDFGAKKDQTLIISTKGTIAAYKILIYGIGDKKITELSSLYHFIASAIRKANEVKPVKVGIHIPEEWLSKFDATEVFRVVGEAFHLANYRFHKYKKQDEKDKPRNIEEVLCFVSPGKLDGAQIGIDHGEIMAKSTIFARDLVNEPPEYTSPQYLATVAQSIAKESKGKITVTILEKEEIKKLGMNAFLAVSKGSDKPPKFIILRYRGKNSKKKIVIIGKGITFDTGGLSLKSAEHMETMKLDMAGAAAVLATFNALIQISPQVHVVGLIAACENMPSGAAIKPGDIVKAANGVSIEILNTDAEGRLTLADAISYARIKEKPDAIIDLATLTGACMIALGQDIAGLFTNNDQLAIEVERAAKKGGELVWKLPVFDGYRKLIKSSIADIKNIQTGRYGGAITAALFLLEFVENTPWVHLDIAGPAFEESDNPLVPKGGTGFGVRTLLQYLSSL